MVKKYSCLYHGMIREGETGKRVHPTQKPVKIYELILKDYSQPGDRVIDPFLGSGTTLIAAHNLDRICYGSEIDLGYCAVILQRYQDHTGEMPKLI